MKIDDRVEQAVRKTLTAVVQRDSDKLASAISSLPGDEATAQGLQLAVALSIFVLRDQYGRNPTDLEIRAVADKLVEMESWTDVTADEVVAALTAAFGRVAVDQVLSPQRALIVSYVIAGNLLSSCHRDDEEWWNYLDRAEAAIEATPDQS